ncbi:integrase core domain protein [mine drainage metagenome]|uniref:Integrase core domain protein n=1 Tax=mine drainage metagenome TaxID=410659 RepID=A0A1J5RZV0_9ZZZZ
MLNQEQLLQLFIQQDIPLVGRRVVETIRDSDPVRRVGGGFDNVVTRYASLKMGCVIQAESHKGELPALYEWEHDPDTHEFYDQPSSVKLAYRNGSGRRVSHLSTPDYFLIQEHWMGWVECKPEEELRKSHDSGSERYVPGGETGWRCPPGEAFAAQFGLGFQVRSTKETNWIVVRNLEFLSDYLAPDCPVPTDNVWQVVQQAFASERWMLLGTLLARDGISADDVFALIARGDLFVDLEHELLAEPIYTNVCRDALSAEVYLAQKSSHRSLAPSILPKVALRPGTPILWDRQPWRILNVGDTEVFLAGLNKDISTLGLDLFQTLVLQGVITGVPPEADERYQLAEQIMRRAAPVDLELAVKRATHLDVAKLDNSKPVATTIPARTLRYWRHRAEEGELATGNRFAGLIPRISARGNRHRKTSAETITQMNEVIDTEVLIACQPKISVCYGMVRNRCQEIGAIPPSEKTFRAEIKRRREETVVLARQGRRAAYSVTEFQWHVDQSTPRHGERPFEIGHIDHTELDIELVDSRIGANLRRPWLTILIDAYTRLIIAFFLTFDPPSYRSCMAVIRNAIRRHGRIPKTIVVDQGSDFESLYFEALLARLECHKKSRPAAKARFGSVMERFFGVNNQAFIHNLEGNSQALQRPRSMSPSHDPRTLAVWTLPALTDAFENFVDNVYGNLIHPALGMSPKDAMVRGLAVSGNRGHVLIPFTEDFNRLCMPTTPAGKAVVRSGRGFKIKGVHYWHPVFREPKVENTKVNIVYDPFDVSRAYALVNGEWVLCRSEHQSIFERRSEREIATISQEIRVLHYLAGVRRGVNAADIAAYISTARRSEDVLRQQRRDAERLATESVQPVLPSPMPIPSEQPISPADLWSGPITHEIFEVLS